MLDLTAIKPLKIEFKYDTADGKRIFSYEGVVSYNTIGVYQKAMQKARKNKAVVTKEQNIEIDLSKQLQTSADAEHAMMESFFGDDYDKFQRALDDCGDSAHVVIQHVVAEIFKYIDELKAEGTDEKK